MLVYSAVLAALLSLARAQGGMPPATYTVIVGLDEASSLPGRGYLPSVIFPSAGDTVTFTFQVPSWIKNPPNYNHSVTESTFDYPCTAGGWGFDTGIQATGPNAGSFDLLINDTSSRWFFSAADGDCKSGMVLAINPNVTGPNTADAFVGRARMSSGPNPPTLSSWSLSPDSTPPPLEEITASAIVSRLATGTGSGSPSATARTPFNGNAAAENIDRAGILLRAGGVVAIAGLTLLP